MSPAMRSCEGCTLCCHLPEIHEFAKPANSLCSNCTGTGCAAYDTRPDLCRDFHCEWLAGDRLGAAWHPLKSRMMVYEQGPQITVLVHPDYHDVWRQAPYIDDMRRWAAEGEASGRYVIVFFGDNVVKIRHDAAEYAA